MLPKTRKIAHLISKNLKHNHKNVSVTASRSASTKPQPILEPEVTNTGVSNIHLNLVNDLIDKLCFKI